LEEEDLFRWLSEGAGVVEDGVLGAFERARVEAAAVGEEDVEDCAAAAAAAEEEEEAAGTLLGPLPLGPVAVVIGAVGVISVLGEV